MQFPSWLQVTSVLKNSGLVLGMLNLALAVLCAITFFGTLAVTLGMSEWLRSLTGNLWISVPFPAPVLLLIYVVVFLLAWALFARRLPPRPWSGAIQTGLVGAIPLFGLSILGYLGVAALLATGDFNADPMLEASVWVYGILSTLILFAGITCTATIALFSPRLHSSPAMPSAS